MSKPVSKAKIHNFRKKLYDITEQELELRAQMKRLYDQFSLDVGDDEIALRHVRQAFYQVQKHRVHQRLVELMEFHPFFGAHPMSSDLFEEEEEEDDGLI